MDMMSSGPLENDETLPFEKLYIWIAYGTGKVLCIINPLAVQGNI